MGSCCTASETAIRRALAKVAERFSGPANADFGFILQRLDHESGGANWAAAATASVPWKAGGLAEYQAALDAIRARIPVIG